jgi:hypothetical protein
MKRMNSASKPLRAELLNEGWLEIDRRNAADLGIKKGTVGMTPLQWQPVLLGQHIWFTDPSLASSHLYIRPFRPQPC